MIYISSKYCENDEYFYSIIIFNYGIFLALSNVIEKLIIYMKKNYDEAFIEKKILMITFFILIIKYIFIISILWILLSFIRSNFEEYDEKNFHRFFWPVTVTILIIMPFFHKCDLIIFNVLYVPFIICYYFGFSLIIEGKFILSFVFIIFLDLVTILILYLIFKNEILMYAGCIIIDAIAILLFNFLWLNNDTEIIVIPIISFFLIVYLAINSCLSKKFYNLDEGGLNKSIFLFDYGLFYDILFLAIGIACPIIPIFVFCSKEES